MFWLWMLLSFCAGFGLMAILKRQPDEECRDCKAHYVGIIRDLELKVHGLKSTKGALAKEIQSLSFRNSGYNAR
jgi:hypothetical protein